MELDFAANSFLKYYPNQLGVSHATKTRTRSPVYPRIRGGSAPFLRRSGWNDLVIIHRARDADARAFQSRPALRNCV